MADEELPDDQEETKGNEPKGTPKSLPPGRKDAPRGRGYFTIYKNGQGYWTRIGTVLCALLIGAFTAYNLVTQIPPRFSKTFNETDPKLREALYNQHTHFVQTVTWSITGAFVLGYVWLCWYLLNKPKHVDFLIATDSEMKKVNWTSRKELIGSTKIVIIFMFMIALFLFTVDWIFGALMYWFGVTSVPPWGV